MDDVRHPSRLPALAAHVFVPDIAAPVLSDADAHHLLRVLRLREGERLTASDGAGAWRECVVTGGALRADGDVERVAAGGRPPPPNMVGAVFSFEEAIESAPTRARIRFHVSYF